MAILIVKLTDTICRVPSQALSLRLSILYLRTCVGLRYGYSYILLLDRKSMVFLGLFQDNTLIFSSKKTFALFLRNRVSQSW